MPADSPIIDRSQWGRIEVSGSIYKDVKLWPGGARTWDWTESGTSHDGGVAVEDVEEILDHGATVVVLSTGRGGRLRVPDTVTGLIQARNAVAEVLGTDEAILRYNELAIEGAPVGALIHTTC